MKKARIFLIRASFLQDAYCVGQHFALSCGQQNGVMFVGKFAGLVFECTAAVPGFHANIRRVFAHRSPECDHGEIREIHLNFFAIGTDKANPFGSEPIEHKGVHPIVIGVVKGQYVGVSQHTLPKKLPRRSQ